jgi:O-antigen ligase
MRDQKPRVRRATRVARTASERAAAQLRRLVAPAAAIAIALGAVFAASESPAIGIGLLGLATAIAVVTGGKTPLAGPALFVVTLFTFSPRYVLGGAQVTPAVVTAAGCAVLLVAGRLAPGPARHTLRSPVVIAIIVYWTVCVLTYAIGVTRPLTATEIARADRYLLVLTLLCAVAVLIVEVASSQAAIRRLAEALVLAAGVLAVVAILQGTVGLDLVETLRLPGFSENLGIAERRLDRLGFQRVRGTATHPIEAGTVLVATLPLSLHVGAFSRTLLGRFAGRAVVLATLIAVLLTLSRSAMVGLVVAVVVMLPRWTPNRRLRVVLSGTAVFVALSIAFPKVVQLTRQLLTDFFGSDISGADLGARTEDYDVVRGIVAEHPFLGRGYGTFDPSVNFATDNQILKTLIEIGVIGLIVLLGLVLVALREGKIAARAATNDRDRDLLFSAQAGFGLVALSMLFYDGFSFMIAIGTFFFLAGLCGAAGALSRQEPTPDTTTTSRLALVDA